MTTSGFRSSMRSSVCPAGGRAAFTYDPPVPVLVVLPTYNEAATVLDVLARIRAAVADADVLVVDDNSPDGTAGLVEGAGIERVHLLTRDRPSGLGSAYRAGFRWGLDR